MARSSRAVVRAPLRSGARSGSKTAKAKAEPPREISSLVLDATDEFHNLRNLHRAYACLEQLMAAADSGDADQFDLDPGKIGAVLKVINDALRQRASKVEDALKTVIEAC